MKQKAISVAVVVAIMVVIVAVMQLQPTSDAARQGDFGIIESAEVTGAQEGEIAPNFRLESFDGTIVELGRIDKPVVLDFWAGWCPFCIEEMSHLEEMHQEFKNEVIFIGIHRSDTESPETGKKFAAKQEITYLLLQDFTGDVYDTFSDGQPFMPIAFFIDTNGVITKRVFGPKTGESIREDVVALIEK